MTLTIADRRAVPEASGLPERLDFKTAEATALQALAIDEAEGLVTAIVSVTGVVDEVDDIIVPGAYRETLAKRRPKVCWAHSWEHPIGKVLHIEELMPGDERLPPTQRDGSPWPREAGALVAQMKFNLRTDEGRNAFEVVLFYSESGECEYSIGYNVPPGRSATDSRGTRLIKMLELYELSVVLFGAHTMTGTLSIKDASQAMEVKRVMVPTLPRRTGKGVDMSALAFKAKDDGHVPPQSVRNNAQHGLDLRKANNGKGGTETGVARARDLARGASLPLATVKRMASFFARHEVDSSADGWGSDANPSAGYIAWLLWGGDAGKRWAEGIVKREEKAKRTSSDFQTCPRCGSNKVSHLAGSDQPRCAECGYHVALKAEAKAPVPPQFRKDEGDESEESVEDPSEQDGEQDECTCCGGSGEHSCGHECYVCDAAGTLAAQREADAGVPDGQPLVCEGHHGRADTDPEAEHDADPVDPTSTPEGTPVAGESTPTAADGEEESPETGEGGEPGADTRPPAAARDEAAPAGAQADPTDEQDAPDFSDGIMVAVYPDPAAADAVAAHIAGPDDTTPREELHVTLAYLGKIGGGAPTEQEVIDAVTRAVEGQPALSGEVGGIGQFPAGDDGAPTYAPVDVPGLGLLREQIVSELGDAVYNDHGFTPHMTLGYNIGIIDPVPPVALSINEVRVVYGNSQRSIALGAPVAEAKARTHFTETDAPEGVLGGDLWFRTSDATMHRFEDNEWKAVDVMTTPAGEVSDGDKGQAKAASYDPSAERAPRMLPGLSAAIESAMASKAGGADRNRGGAEELRRYWTTGEGGVKIGWGTPGDFSRCVALLDEHMPGRAEGYCANRHKEMTGMWPGDKDNKDAGAQTAVKVPIPSGQSKSYPQMPGSYEEHQQALREALYAQYADDVDEDGQPRVWVDLRSTWPDRLLYTVERFSGIGGGGEHYLVTYRMDDDGMIEFGEHEEVELSIVPIPVDGVDIDDVPIGDALPIVEDVMAIATSFKAAQRAMEGKAGRVLSGANERAIRTAVEHLVNVLSGAGMELGEAVVDRARPTGNTGSDADVRREVDPSVDLETTSPVATTKAAPGVTEAKGLGGGEVLTIDMDAHRALLAAIDDETTTDA